MKKPAFFVVCCLFSAALLPLAAVTHARAEEATKSDSAKGGEGGEGGGKKKGSDDVSGGRFAGDPIYVHIAPMVLPVIDNSGVEQLVTVILDVQVKDFDAADNMHANMPRVVDALMTSLYGGLGQGTLRNGRLANVTKIKSKAIDAIGSVIGKDKIIDVLVQGVSQRML